MYSPQNPEDLLAITDKTVFLTVVGVVPSVKLSDLAEGEKTVGAYYFPIAQNTSGFMSFALKTSVDPESLGPALRSAVAAVDRDLPVFDVQTMEQRKEKALLGRRSPALLSVAFGVVALLLSAVGLYGVLAYLVTQRTKEFGIRIALGSSAGEIFKLVIREGLGLLATGLVIGAMGAFALRHSLESQLFGVRSGDPRVLAGVTLLLGAVAVLACALPARRATRIDPRTALAE
jgi:ABC-type antimicrobial peptide transport system permease subunit